MKKIVKTAAYILLGIAAIGCAKAVTEGVNDANVRYFESWMKINHPDLKPTGLGIYVLEEEKGTGIEVKEDGFVYADYVITDLEGNILNYTDEETARQLGTYDRANYYGPRVVTTIENTIQAGLAEAIIGMKAGGRRKVIIPSWLMSFQSYKTEAEYIANSSSGDNTIYDITIRDYTDSIPEYEDQLIHDYMNANPLVFKDFVKPLKDSAFYYQRLSKPVAEPEKFAEDTTIYINYTGKLLNGLVFDTTIERVAKDNGIYSPSREYEPAQINWGENWYDITMGSNNSSIISGFALTLWQMHPMEKGIGIFYSPLGYSYSGSGSGIPGYAPLIFEIEIVDKPE